MNFRKITLVFGLISSFCFAQNTRFVYQVSMKTDSTAAPTVENAYLDVSAGKSSFYSEKRIQRDSIMRRAIETRSFDFNRTQMEQYRTKISYQIDKAFDAQKVVYKNRIGRDLYAYEEDRPMNWAISKETTKIGEYKVQKAETEFAGRKWTAWFTQDVPVMDGPYKFFGLPGLIVKIEDQKGDYSFDLKQSKKLAELPNMDGRMGSVVAVKRKDYEKQLAVFEKDPVSFFNSQMSGNDSFRGPNGVEMRGSIRMDPARMKEREARLKEELKANNNPLELKEVKK